MSTEPSENTISVINRISLHKYDIPLSPYLPVAKQRIANRQGLLLTVFIDGKSSYSEIAPLSGVDTQGLALKGFSEESLEQVILYLKDNLPKLLEQPIDSLAELAENCPYPSAALGLSVNYAKLTDKLPLPRDSFSSIPLIYINNESVDLSIDNLSKSIAAQLAEFGSSIKSVKIKVGQLTPATEIALIYAVLATNPKLKIRLDANRAFTLEQGINFCACLPLDAIEYIEEPCQNPLDNPALYKALGIHYALDESLNDPQYQFAPQMGLTALVIKPMLIGSIVRLQKLIHQASTQGVRCILSSALESSLGIADIKRLACMLTPDETPGVDTLTAFTQTLVEAMNRSSSDKPCLQPDDLELLLECQ